jgi:ribosomal silencing factor RsfS
LENGTLVVHVLQPTVHFELERVWKRKLLVKLQEKFGRSTVREIRFRLG